ncbi:uncharacterized protein TRAVEDRAFT_43329 [Trametes versicolor FP-101664 SS1]|uniref:uncharacterized protein n=1 Tax=Trametes versicolor (strain FP-101664) TaxID=717944 RepID=UPI0004622055|nr:uncharacterized protein TRAVEDRAFT_43329 [Trametes versicolor FP-101664 SS1]EIW63025.1 hypothetical protein TRAVEDRAFT_43329 [Trametes versicolor FP-101664 SS1]
MPPKNARNNVKMGRATPSGLLGTATREQISDYTMLQSIATGTFEDVKFYLFSRRRGGSGFVYAPRPLYANSALICKASAHFDFVLSAGFSEGVETDMNAPFPPNRKSSTQEYDYALDSDLEDDGGEDDEDAEWDTTVQPVAPRLTVGVTDGDKSSGPGAPAVDIGRPSSPLSEKGALVPKFQGSTSSLQGGKEPTSVAEDTDHTVAVRPSNPARTKPAPRKGRVVFIEDIAYRTWEAFIFYAYSDRVAFAPLTSQRAPYPTRSPFEPPPCSPKSMYRLADKYGIDALKALALDDLKNKTTRHNILLELFSPFTFTYSEVQDAELARLRRDHIAQDEVLRDIPKWLQALEDGKRGW